MILPPKMPFFICQKAQILSKILPKIWKFASFHHSKMKAFLQRILPLLLKTGFKKSCKDCLMLLACTFSGTRLKCLTIHNAKFKHP